jgi:hypothetical protein
VRILVHDLDVGLQVDVRRCHLAGAALVYLQLHRLLTLERELQVLEVEYDVHDVLGDARDCRELVRDSLYAYLGDRGPL